MPRAARDPAGPVVQAPNATRPRVELVFALDTTGSMSGLIEGAKQKIWSLASFVAQGQPTPDLRVGLIAYRDVGDAYVTKVFDLDDDLDRVYRRLRAFHADGGGDGPEHVARALHESVNKMSWSQAQEVVKVIYLVGDAPPHTDYQDGYDYVRAARAAAGKGIQLHTIQCGTDNAAEGAWRKIASLGGGQYMAIHQDGGMQAEHSRYDDELATPARQARGARRSVTAPAAPAVAAARAMADGGAGAGQGGARGVHGEEQAGGRRRGRPGRVDRERPGEAGRRPGRPARRHEGDGPGEAGGGDRGEAEGARSDQQADRRADRRCAARSSTRDEAKAAKAGKADGFDIAAKKALRKSVKDNARSGLALIGSAMNTNWRFRDHRGFQHDAVVVIGAAGAVGALTWALPLTGATWWMMMAVGPLLALLVGQADRAGPAARV